MGCYLSKKVVNVVWLGGMVGILGWMNGFGFIFFLIFILCVIWCVVLVLMGGVWVFLVGDDVYVFFVMGVFFDLVEVGWIFFFCIGLNCWRFVVGVICFIVFLSLFMCLLFVVI